MAHKARTYYWPVVAWVTVLLAFAVVSLPEAPQPAAWNIDKVRHAAAYALLGALTARAVAASSGRQAPAAVGAFFLVFAVGVVTEVIQTFVPRRSADFIDLAADLTGGLAGALLFLWALGPAGGDSEE